MTKIYHNPRCSKSRQALALLEEKNENIEVIKYLETELSVDQLTNIITMLEIPPLQLVRKNEAIWKENFKTKSLSDKELIEVMVENPKLIERPIVIKNGKAAIGRPLSNILDIL